MAKKKGIKEVLDEILAEEAKVDVSDIIEEENEEKAEGETDGETNREGGIVLKRRSQYEREREQEREYNGETNENTTDEYNGETDEESEEEGEGIELEVRDVVYRELEDGLYEAVLKEVEVIPTRFGEALRWVFELTDEGVEGVEVAGLTTLRVSRLSKAGKWIQALKRGALNGSKSINTKELIGRRCIVEIMMRDTEYGLRLANVVDVKPLRRR